jgi:hypothetical protein
MNLSGFTAERSRVEAAEHPFGATAGGGHTLDQSIVAQQPLPDTVCFFSRDELVSFGPE